MKFEWGEIILFAIAFLMLMALAFIMTGCTIAEEKSADIKHVAIDCTLEHADGTTMRCQTGIDKDKAATGKETDIDSLPVQLP